MQSKNEVVISGECIFPKRQLSLTIQPTELEKRDCYPTFCYCLDFKLYSSLLQCSGCVQSKNGVDLVEVSIFKSEKTSFQTVRLIKIETAALSYLILAT